MAFPNRTIEKIWISSIEALIDIEYVIKTSGREGGLILAEHGQGPALIIDSENPHTLNILIRKSNGGIMVTCQSRIQRVATRPEKEIDKFFAALEEIPRAKIN